jgi:uncharacterized protein YjbJ (UPF0337 family)
VTSAAHNSIRTGRRLGFDDVCHVPDRGTSTVEPQTEKELMTMGDRKQRLKGKANEAAGKTKGAVGRETGSGKTEAKGAGKALKGKAQQATGKARSAAKKKTR